MWENPQVEDLFARFVTRVVEALDDQVTLWCTVNEPIVYAYSGYMGGESFPLGANSVRRAFNVLRQMLLAHGRADRTIHRLQTGARVGRASRAPVPAREPGQRCGPPPAALLIASPTGACTRRSPAASCCRRWARARASPT